MDELPPRLTDTGKLRPEFTAWADQEMRRMIAEQNYAGLRAAVKSWLTIVSLETRLFKAGHEPED